MTEDAGATIKRLTRANARIGAAERLLRSVVDSLDGRMCIIGDDGVIVGSNRLWDEFAAEMGWGVAESGIGADFFTLMTQLRGELGPSLTAAARDILDGKTTTQFSVRGYLPLIGRGEDIIVRMHPVVGHDNGRAVITLIDISGAVRRERELRRVTDEAQLLALVAQHTDNAVVITDAIGQIEWANEAFSKACGYSPDDLIGLRRRDLVKDAFAGTPTFAAYAKALESGQGAKVEFPTGTKDGETYWVRVETEPILEDGEPVRFLSIERDVTEQRAADHRLNSEKSVLDEVLAAIPQLVYWKDADLRYLGVNSAFMALRGLVDAKAVLGRPERELEHRDELTTVLAVLEPQVLSTGRSVEHQRLILTAPGRPPRRLLLNVLPKTDEEGVVCGVIGVATDLTHLSDLDDDPDAD